MLKIIIITFFLISTVLPAHEQKAHKHLSYDVSVALLHKIDKDAIILGSGEKQLYAFIDPLCPHSRKFVTMVSKNSKMLKKYQYHFFLYAIPRLKSDDVISAVYMSDTPVKTLLEIMVQKKVHRAKRNKDTQAKINRIKKVAQEIDVYKRPYIFIMK